MANQIYYGASYPSGVGAGYALRAAEAYLPATVGSSLYSANGIALTGVGEQASYIYSSQNNGLMPPGTEISGVGSVGNYSAGMIGSGLTSAAFRGADGLGMAATVNAGSKRSVEALYNQSILAHSTVAPSDALLSAYSLVKYPKLASASHLPIYPQRPGEKDCAHYMLTRTCKFGEACKFDHPIWVPEGGIPDWKEVPFVPASESLPQKPGEPDCPYFLKTQTCKYGLKCKFNHPKEKQNLPVTVFKTDGFLVNSELPQRPSEPVCTFYAKTGKCKFGASCKFNHPKDNQIQSAGYLEKNEETTNNYDATRGDPSHTKTFIPPALWHNSKGLPIRPGETDCPFYLKTGSCKFGATCRYNHPDRYFVDSTHTASINNAIITPTVAGLSYGVLNPAASYLPNIDPRLTQVGVAVYPQRPGEIECDYYMKTGHCKFGERCKYHHPIDRSAPPASSINPTQENVKLTLAGLPRREGALPCPFYMKTGTCKYGAVCKFDHPPPGEAIAMAQGSSGDTTSEEEEEEEEEEEVDT